MIDPAAVSGVLEQAAALTPGLRDLSRASESRWLAAFDEEAVAIDAGAKSALVFFCSIGRPNPARREEIAQVLLLATALQRETGGMFFGLMKPEGDAALAAEIHQSRATPERVAAVLSNLNERATFWRAFLSAEPGEVEPAPSHPMIAI